MINTNVKGAVYTGAVGGLGNQSWGGPGSTDDGLHVQIADGYAN